MANNRFHLNFLNDWLDQLAIYFIDDAKWSKISRRSIISLTLVALILVVHTSLIYSPRFLIGALYHGRTVGVPTVTQMNDNKSEKMLDRMYSLYVLFHGDKPIKNRYKKLHVP